MRPTEPPSLQIHVWHYTINVKPADLTHARLDLVVWRAHPAALEVRVIRGVPSPLPALPTLYKDWMIAAVLTRPACSYVVLKEHIEEWL